MTFKFIKRQYLLLFLILTIALTNYQFARLIQRVILFLFPSFSYTWSLSLPWILVGIVLSVWTLPSSGLKILLSRIKKNWLHLLAYSLIVCSGLGLFYIFGITKYFHSVKNPFIFFIITPVAEELIFRGWIYGQLEKIKISPILGSSILFGLHHLQYFRYIPTPFAIFQVVYTFILGLLLGKMRGKSGSVYLSIAMHILINWFTVNF